MSKILIKNPLVLTMCDGEKIEQKDVLIINKKIALIKENIKVEDDMQIINGNNSLLMPGFVNAHAHSAMVFSRSSSDNLVLTDWLNHCIFPMEAQFIKNDVYYLTKVAYLEYLTSGITSCFDMYYNPQEIARASKEMNFKTVILAAPPAERITEKEIIESYDYLNSYDKDLVSAKFGVHAEYTSTLERLNSLAHFVNFKKDIFATHCCETVNETQGCKERHNNMSPVELFDSLGLFNYGGTLFHCIYLTDNDIKILKEKNVSVVTCPGSNGKLASGIAPIKRLIDEGINVAIGTDGAGSNNCLDMFKEMHLLYSFSKVREKDPRALKAFDILKMATINGAKALGLEKLDGIKEGNYADLILIDLLRPNMQPINNIISNIVYSGSKDNIKMTMINGKVLYRNREFFINEDIPSLYKKCQEINDRLNKDNPYK